MQISGCRPGTGLGCPSGAAQNLVKFSGSQTGWEKNGENTRLYVWCCYPCSFPQCSYLDRTVWRCCCSCPCPQCPYDEWCDTAAATTQQEVANVLNTPFPTRACVLCLQVLSPTRRKGMAVGTEELNEQLQPIMNPSTSNWNSNGHGFAVKDRVIQVSLCLCPLRCR
jgi:hypothetical protein